MGTSTKGARKIGSRHYEIIGAFHLCGGQLAAEATGRRGEFLWELYCRNCKDCDANGYGTLAECVAAVREAKKGRLT